MTQTTRRGNKCAICHDQIRYHEDWLPAGTYDNGKQAYAHAFCFLTPVEPCSGAVHLDVTYRYAGHVHGHITRLA